MSALINVILPVFLAAGVAGLVQPYLKLDIQVLSKAAFYLFGPAMTFYALATANITGDELGRLAISQALFTLLLWGLGALAARTLKLQGTTRGAFLVALVMMNAGNYGYPVNLFAFGEEGLSRAVLYVTINSLFSSNLGIYLVARSHIAPKDAVKAVFSVPTIYAAALGILFNLTGWTVPEPILKTTQILGEGIVPALMVVLGVQLANVIKSPKDNVNIPALLTLAAGRLLISPLIAWSITGFTGLTGLTRDVVIVESAMPSAVMSMVLTTEYDSDPGFAALAVFTTTLISLLTVTLLLNLLGV
ncbi:MAG: AEC family transporter [Anaerolineae bacterium]|nr:AEC family transporter [Anaerolineae bacterium]